MNNENKQTAEKTLNDSTSLEDVVLGLGYAMLALTDAVHKAMELPAEPAVEAVVEEPAEEPVNGHGPRPVANLPEQLARGILERQLARGEATVEWENRGESRRIRTDVAGVILSQNLLNIHQDVAAEVLCRRYGFGTTTARLILEDARAVQDADAAHEEQDAPDTLDQRIAELERLSRTLLLQAGWTPDVPESDGPTSWQFTAGNHGEDVGWCSAGDAIQSISDDGRGISRKLSGQEFHEIWAKADAILYGEGFTAEGIRLKPQVVRRYVTATAATLTA